MIKDFKALRITAASPQQILSWSHGEVKKAETINYRTHSAEVDGLMDEKIFGPTKNFECYCGKYKKIRYKGIVCDKCGVEVTHKRVRRERMGHIKLASPVAHVWFAHGVPNKLSLILGIPQKKLETVIYFARYLVTSFDEAGREQTVDKVKQEMDAEVEELKKNLDAKIKETEDMYKEKVGELKKGEKNAEKINMQVEQLKDKEKKEIAKLRSIYTQKERNLKSKSNDKLNLVKNIKTGATLSEEELSSLREYEVDFMEVGMGAEAVEKLLAQVNIQDEVTRLREEQSKTKSQAKKAKYIQRLRILEGMLRNDINPTWLILKVLPVIPPELRPVIQLPGGRFATSDLNDLYRRVINRNNRLKRLISLGAPEIILRNEKRMLQESVDALIDNSHRPGNPVQNSKQQPYKSLSDMLRGKQGRFRQNLLGKRVDYSGRAVIVAGPELNMYQCGLPKIIALELFKPFVIREIIADGLAPNIKSAKHYFESKSDQVWDILERVIQNRPVLLNRAPTLHKQGIQAFFPILTEGNAISVHPMVCKGFNADFDGDQMAVHLPLSYKAIEEVMERMFADSNLLLMADGSPVIGVAKDMALGVYYMTSEETEEDKIKKEVPVFSSIHRAIGAYERGDLNLRDKIKVLTEDGQIIETTAGRLKFNEVLPEGYAGLNKQVTRKDIGKLAADILKKFNSEVTINFLDNVETIGFKYATKCGYSTAYNDFKESEKTRELIAKVEEKENQLTKDYYNGLLTMAEKKRLIEEAWMEVIDEIAEVTWKEYNDPNNPLNAFENSGALPISNPLRQIAGVKGLILDPLGNIVELPLRSNYKHGLPTLEYFVAARGTRKGLADTALKTAESGYLTRKLVDVAQDVIVRDEDCGTDEGTTLLRAEKRMIEFADRIIGRFLAQDVVDPKTGEVIAKQHDEITPDVAAEIEKLGLDEIKVRSALTCHSKEGICQKCYGYNLGTQRLVDKGIAVGVIAAQAMGEAATQLTLNTKHLAGRAGTDITQGLPRVAELFEARTPKGKAILADIAGVVTIVVDKDGDPEKLVINDRKKYKKEFEIGEKDVLSFKRSKKVKKGDTLLTREDGTKIEAEFDGQVMVKDSKLVLEVDKEVEQEYELTLNDILVVKDGDQIEKGMPLTAGSISPKELMELGTVDQTQKYIIDNIQETYGIQGIAINDKHVEVIVRQMFRFLRVTTPGDSTYLPGDFVNVIAIEEENRRLKEAGKEPVRYKRVLLGITAASLNTESFLSAASFQEQVRVLTDAALVGKIDNLRGLKENVIIGRPVPLGRELR